eukprot:Hpha_TRINITY_DN15473_c0_g3::TRINITY_DN15473_c0_g3_i1::g.174081::m.174081
MSLVIDLEEFAAAQEEADKKRRQQQAAAIRKRAMRTRTRVVEESDSESAESPGSVPPKSPMFQNTAMQQTAASRAERRKRLAESTKHKPSPSPRTEALSSPYIQVDHVDWPKSPSADADDETPLSSEDEAEFQGLSPRSRSLSMRERKTRKKDEREKAKGHAEKMRALQSEMGALRSKFEEDDRLERNKVFAARCVVAAGAIAAITSGPLRLFLFSPSQDNPLSTPRGGWRKGPRGAKDGRRRKRRKDRRRSSGSRGSRSRSGSRRSSRRSSVASYNMSGASTRRRSRASSLSFSPARSHAGSRGWKKRRKRRARDREPHDFRRISAFADDSESSIASLPSVVFYELEPALLAGVLGAVVVPMLWSAEQPWAGPVRRYRPPREKPETHSPLPETMDFTPRASRRATELEEGFRLDKDDDDDDPQMPSWTVTRPKQRGSTRRPSAMVVSPKGGHRRVSVAEPSLQARLDRLVSDLAERRESNLGDRIKRLSLSTLKTEEMINRAIQRADRALSFSSAAGPAELSPPASDDSDSYDPFVLSPPDGPPVAASPHRPSAGSGGGVSHPAGGGRSRRASAMEHGTSPRSKRQSVSFKPLDPDQTVPPVGGTTVSAGGGREADASNATSRPGRGQAGTKKGGTRRKSG